MRSISLTYFYPFQERESILRNNFKLIGDLEEFAVFLSNGISHILGAYVAIVLFHIFSFIIEFDFL